MAAHGALYPRGQYKHALPGLCPPTFRSPPSFFLSLYRSRVDSRLPLLLSSFFGVSISSSPDHSSAILTAMHPQITPSIGPLAAKPPGRPSDV